MCIWLSSARCKDRRGENQVLALLGELAHLCGRLEEVAGYDQHVRATVHDAEVRLSTDKGVS